MDELRTLFPYALNDRIGDEFKTDNKHMLLLDFYLCQENIVVPIVIKITKVFPVFYYKNLVNTSIKGAPDFIRISISSMKKSYLKITHELLRTKLCDSPPDFIFCIYYHQAIDLIKSKICKPLALQLKKKLPQNYHCVQYIF